MLTFGDTAITPYYRTTSVTAQLEAVKSGSAIAVLPRYMGDQYSEFEMVLPNEIGLERTYWIAVHHDLVDSRESARSCKRSSGGFIEIACSSCQTRHVTGLIQQPQFADLPEQAGI
jgi:LysR substrate binding domain.